MLQQFKYTFNLKCFFNIKFAVVSPLAVDGEGEHGSGLEAVTLHEVLALAPRGHVVQGEDLQTPSVGVKMRADWPGML